MRFRLGSEEELFNGFLVVLAVHAQVAEKLINPKISPLIYVHNLKLSRLGNDLLCTPAAIKKQSHQDAICFVWRTW